jgi:glycerophosphoryl diester phosphodiesterase
MGLLSAHNQGVGFDHAAQNTIAGVTAAARSHCDFVEFDVQRCVDGTYVAHHDSSVFLAGELRPVSALTHAEFIEATGTDVTVEDICGALGDSAKAHVDLKFHSPDELYDTPLDTYEVDFAKKIVSYLGAEGAILTTTSDASVKAIRAWSADAEPSLLVGLSLGRIISHLATREQLKIRVSEAFPGKRLRACNANLIVAQKILASLSLIRYAVRHDIPILVWTVDDEKDLRKLLADDRIWMVTSNFPGLVSAAYVSEDAPMVSVLTEDPPIT